MNFHNLTFSSPAAVILLGGLFFLLALLVKLFRYRKQQLVRYTSSDLLPQLIVPRSRTFFAIKGLGLCVIWILCTVALMDPISYGFYAYAGGGEGPPIAPEQRQPREVLILIDASASMGAKDLRSGESRLEAAKEIADNLVDRLDGAMVALEAFTSIATPLSPFTFDALFVRLMLRQIAINEGGAPGTWLLDVLQTIWQRYFEEITVPLKSVVILTDGEDTHLEELSPQAASQEMQKKLWDIEKLKDNRLRVFTVGIGSRKGAAVPGVIFEGKPVISAVNEALLRKISQDGRGRYFFADDYAVFDLVSELSAAMGKENVSSSQAAQEGLMHTLYFQWLTGFVLLILAFVLIWPDTRVRRSL